MTGWEQFAFAGVIVVVVGYAFWLYVGEYIRRDLEDRDE